jgi:hypothetical protein
LFRPARSGNDVAVTGAADSCVERLAQLVGAVRRVVEEYDWPAIESSLGGLSLPRDYRAFVETFPPGVVDDRIRVIRPGDVHSPRTEYLGYYAYRMNDMRQRRAGGHGRYPYTIFPEPGGVLPWGEGANGELYFSLTGASDADAWTVVWPDRDEREWRAFPGSMCEFLIGVVTGKVDVPAFPPEPAGFRPARWGLTMPENDFQELSRVMGTKYTRPGKTNWLAFESEVGAVAARRLPRVHRPVRRRDVLRHPDIRS